MNDLSEQNKIKGQLSVCYQLEYIYMNLPIRLKYQKWDEQNFPVINTINNCERFLSFVLCRNCGLIY